MKIEQSREFQPITITLETPGEAEALWMAIRNTNPACAREPANAWQMNFFIKLSDWFSNQSKL